MVCLVAARVHSRQVDPYKAVSTQLRLGLGYKVYSLLGIEVDPAGKWEKGNLINANCALASPPHYPPLVEPLRPGPTLVTHAHPTLLPNLLPVSPTPACTLFFFFFALLPAVLLLPLLPVPQLPPLLLWPSPRELSLPPTSSPPLWLSPLRLWVPPLSLVPLSLCSLVE